MRVYVAGPLGFSTPTKTFHDDVLVPSLRQAGFAVLDPWQLGEQVIGAALALANPREREAALRASVETIGQANAEMIDGADGVFAVLDGADVDSGTAAEIGWAAAKGVLIVGWRTDLRRAGDHGGTEVNLQVQHFIERAGGVVVANRPLSDAVAALRALLA